MNLVLFRAAVSRFFCGKCKADQQLNSRVPSSVLFAEEGFLQSQGLLFFSLRICASSSLPISSDFARRPMTPPSPLFPCTCLGYLPARPSRNSVPQADASSPPPSPCPSTRDRQRNEGSLFSDPQYSAAALRGHLPVYSFHIFHKIRFSVAPIPLQYIVSRHIPRTRPSGVTIYLSSRPNTGDHSVSGGHA